MDLGFHLNLFWAVVFDSSEDAYTAAPLTVKFWCIWAVVAQQNDELQHRHIAAPKGSFSIKRLLE